MTYYLVFVLLMGNGPSRIVMPKLDKIEFKTMAECQEAQQELLWDPQFIKNMFNSQFVVVPTCFEVEGVSIKR